MIRENPKIDKIKYRLVIECIIAVKREVPTSFTVSINSTHPPMLPANAIPEAPMTCISIKDAMIFAMTEMVAILAAFVCLYVAYKKSEKSFESPKGSSPNINILKTSAVSCVCFGVKAPLSKSNHIIGSQSSIPPTVANPKEKLSNQKPFVRFL